MTDFRATGKKRNIATCVRLNSVARDVASIKPIVESRTLTINANEALVEIFAAGVNLSDVEAATGLIPSSFPRTPGRDFAGVVVDGPPSWIGREVFGTSGDLGLRRDGSHATHLVVEADALVEKPDGVSAVEAAGIGVPFVAAIEGFRRAGKPTADETVLIMGLNGKVGQAAAQLATWWGARVIGVVRKDEPYWGHANAEIDLINSSAVDVASRVHELTNGRGADVVFNTVGDPYFETAHGSLALGGRQIFIAATDKMVQFDILEFYQRQHMYVGIDTLTFSSIYSATVLRDAIHGFSSGDLRPFPISPGAIFPLCQAGAAYRAATVAPSDRVILKP